MSRIPKAPYLQVHGAQLQRHVSQEHEPPHWHVQVVFRIASLRFFRWRLAFDFMVVDFLVVHGPVRHCARIHRPFTPANEPANNPLHSFFIENSQWQELLRSSPGRCNQRTRGRCTPRNSGKEHFGDACDPCEA